MTTATAGRINIAEARASASGRWFSEILPSVGFDREDLDGRHHPCPWCGGTDRFRAIDAAAGAVFCSQCFNDDNGSGFDAVMKHKNCTFPEALRIVADILGITPESARAQQRHLGIVEATAIAKRVKLQAWIDFGAHPAEREGREVARLPMFNAAGDKCSYCDFALSGAKLLKGLAAKGLPVGVYYAKRPQPGDVVILCEGPKDAAAAHSLGYHAVGMPTCKLAAKFAPIFRGCTVIIVWDLDAAGYESFPVTASRLIGFATRVLVARLPGEVKSTDGDGIREVLARTDGETLVRQAIESATEWSPSPQESRQPISASGAEWTSLQTNQGRTDLANSRRFLSEFRDRVRFCHPWGKWLIWTGTHWQIDESGALLRMAKAIADQVWIDAKQCLDREVATFAVKTSGRASLRAMLDLAAAEVPVSVAELDSNPFLLNCPNGTVDLRTGSIFPHRREDMITKLCPTNYEFGADAAAFYRFMESVFGDGELIQFLQRLLGHCLSGDVSEQILTVFYGTGSNGKSTLLKLIQSVMGCDYASAAPACLLMEKKTEGHPTEVAGLFGTRLAVAQETNSGAKLAEATVKSLTGGDPISARRMREDFWTFTPTHKLILSTNHKPRIKGTDHAIWRRLVLVPFDRKFWNPAKGETGPAELQQDKTLPEKLLAESRGVLSWLVQGCVEWQLGGLQIPDCVRAATEQYRSEEDTVGRFVGECCLTGSAYRVKFASLYEAFEEWCNDCGANLPSRMFVGKYLKEHGFHDKQSGTRWYLGIGLKDLDA